MTGKSDTPEESNEQKKDVYNVFGDLRESLAADEAPEEQPSDREKKGLLSSLKNIRLRKIFKGKMRTEETMPSPTPVNEDVEDVDSDVVEEDDADLEERLAIKYLDEAEALIDEDEIPIDDVEDDELLEEIDEPEPEPEKVANTPRLSETLETDADHIRDIALEDYADDELEEVDERKRAWSDFARGGVRRSEWLILAVLGLVVGGAILFSSIRANGGVRFSEPAPTRTPDPNIPIPTSIQLPGGWTFRLGEGSLNAEGRWDPYGAEWLKGTEICKWIALPWSTQLEAVVRTLGSDDEIEVTMSNYDVLTYHVYSRQEVSGTDAEELNLDVPSVLIILANDDSDQKWVVTAVLDYEDTE